MFGLEIEFCAPYGVLDKINESIRPLRWTCKPEATTDTRTHQGMEIVSNKWTEFPVRSYQNVLDVVNFYSPQINKYCGLHFHFSGFGRISPLRKARHYLLNKVDFWKERAEFLYSYNKGSCTKEHTVRMVDMGSDHYEIRVFNSTFDIDTILENLEFTKQFIGRFTHVSK